MTEFHVTPVTVLAVLLLYVALYGVITSYGDSIARPERATARLVGICWAVSTFVLNYLLYRAGVMSFMPWLTNFLHTFLWIGCCLTLMYMGVRRSQPLWRQCLIYAVFSLVVKYAEQMLFGTWDLDHFFHVLQGNTAYVLGWSIADGLYPPITLFGLRFVNKFMKGIVPT